MNFFGSLLFTTFFAAGLRTAVFFTAAFFAAGLRTAAFFTAGLRTAAFFVAEVFLAAGAFLDVVDFDADLLGTDFLDRVVGLVAFTAAFFVGDDFFETAFLSAGLPAVFLDLDLADASGFVAIQPLPSLPYSMAIAMEKQGL